MFSKYAFVYNFEGPLFLLFGPLNDSLGRGLCNTQVFTAIQSLQTKDGKRMYSGFGIAFKNCIFHNVKVKGLFVCCLQKYQYILYIYICACKYHIELYQF